MADHPRYPQDGDETDPARQPATPVRHRLVSALAIVLALGLLIAFVVLHVTGVLGPGSH